jgi:hypothetical protein
VPESLGFDLLHFVYVLSAALVVGGGVALGGAAAPALFRTLERAEAATAFGSALERWDSVAVLSSIVLVITAFWRALAFEAGEFLAARWVAIAIVLAATLYSSAWANPIARGLRRQTPDFDELPAAAPERREFARYHARSARAMSLAVLGGLVALYLS